MLRVLLVAQDAVGSAMAGPGIRSWELARQISRHHEVTLAVPHGSDLDSSQFAIVDQTRLTALVKGHDVCLTQIVDPALLGAARLHRTKLIVDFYDPILLETLENDRELPAGLRRARNRRLLAKTRLALATADAVLCATERQRDLWLGNLMALDRLTPAQYDADPTMDGTLAVVPFGLPGDEPLRTGPGPREIFRLGADDVVLLWGGGVWDWLDPLTLVQAVAEIRARRADLRLVFMGLQRPTAPGTSTAMLDRLQKLAHDLGEIDRGVFFNHGWVDYQDRANYLLDADVGVSAHFEHLETRYAFRTRMLDYLWAGLPLVSTRGDDTAAAIERAGAGLTVAPADVPAMKAAIEATLDARARQSMHAAALRLREQYRWDVVAAPLLEVLDRLEHTSHKRQLHLGHVTNWFWQSARQAATQRLRRHVRDAKR